MTTTVHLDKPLTKLSEQDRQAWREWFTAHGLGDTHRHGLIFVPSELVWTSRSKPDIFEKTYESA
jgi:hypothetical protein